MKPTFFQQCITRMRASPFAKPAAWLGLLGSPAAIALTLLVLSQSHYVGTGAHPYDMLFLVALLGVFLSAWGFAGATRVSNKTLRTVSVLGLVANTLLALPFLLLTLICFGSHGPR